MSILDGLQNISNDKRHYLSQEPNFWIRSHKFGSQSSSYIFHGPFHRDSPVQLQVLNLLDCQFFCLFQHVNLCSLWSKINFSSFVDLLTSRYPPIPYFSDVIPSAIFRPNKLCLSLALALGFA